MKPDPEDVRRIIEAALAEDGADGDVTSSFLDLTRHSIEASIIAHTPGVVAGIDIAAAVFEATDPATRFDAGVRDGQAVAANAVVASLAGWAGPILAAERVALNLLQRLSGVATLTRRFVEAVSGSGIRILDTRKTTPLLRALERYAVRIGGGHNHRFNLSDMILIKENHLRSMGGIGVLKDAIAKRKPEMPVEVEVDSMDAVRMIAGARVDRIMLDNFSPDEVRAAVRELGRAQVRPEIEVSGGITLDNVERYCIEGVVDISIGALTHSAMPLDFSLEVREP